MNCDIYEKYLEKDFYTKKTNIGIHNDEYSFMMNNKLIKRIGSLNASFVTYLVPVSSITLGILILDEVFTIDMIIGSSLIFLGVFFSNKEKTN